MVSCGWLAALDTKGAMVAIHNRDAGSTSSFSGTIDHVGQQNVFAQGAIVLRRVERGTEN
jgi:hypothetical protein